MIRRTGSFYMFRGRQVSEFLAEHSHTIQAAIEQAPEDYILNVNEEEYLTYLIAEFTIDTPRIDFDGMFVDDYEKQVPAEQFPQGIYVIPGKTYPKQVIVYHIPFTGNAELFHYTPRQYQWSYPYVFIEGHDICWEFIRFGNDPDEIKRQAQSNIDSIKFFSANVTQEMDAYNAQLRGAVGGNVQARKQKLLGNRNMLASLGVPLKKRDDIPQTFAIPTPQLRKSIAVKPTVTAKGYTPEPTLDQTMYHEILQVIHDTGKVFERLPSTYKDKGEEDLRDHLLLQLEPRFGLEGSVTGETFNKIGKTDILIRYKNANVFVAECKFWRGQEQYLDTITQLLGYLTWRDSKAAVIIFVKNKDISPVLQTVKDISPRHPNYLSFVDEQDQSWLNYRFHINDDPNREVKLAVMLFHIPPTFNKRQK